MSKPIKKNPKSIKEELQEIVDRNAELGFDCAGYNEKGLDMLGFNPDGVDMSGYDKFGHNKAHPHSNTIALPQDWVEHHQALVCHIPGYIEVIPTDVNPESHQT